MSQKSSVIQIANLVPWVLTPDNQRIAQGSSRSLALYCLGSRETQREASVT
jgi:hypothetical protein